MKKKILLILLVIAFAASFFAGCGSSPSVETNPTPTPMPTGSPNRPHYDGSVIEFKMYGTGEGVMYDNRRTHEWLEEEYGLRISHTIPVIASNMSTRETRQVYAAEIANLFIDPTVAPDFMPDLKGSCVGSEGAWRDIGYDFLIDFNPYLGVGGILQPYVDYVWGAEGTELGLWDNQKEYWYSAKAALEVEGKLYVLPRRECQPIDDYLSVSMKGLNAIEMTLDQVPSDWDDFVNMLEKYKALKKTSTPLLAYEGQSGNILRFIATTYGLDFNEDYSWTQKNGEPLWSYYWDEYLEVLKDVKMLVEKGLVAVDNSLGYPVISNYTMEYSGKDYENIKRKTETSFRSAGGIVAYAGQQEMARYSSYGGQGLTGWVVAKTTVAHDGYKSALSGLSGFDAQRQEKDMGGYIAIGSALGEEFALRIMDMLAYCCSDEGYMHHCYGKEGTPFADTLEEAGSYIYDENGKIHTWFDYRMDWDTVEYPLFSAYDEHVDQIGGSYTEHSTDEDSAELYGITDTSFWAARYATNVGILMFAPVTTYHMKLSAYWYESDSYQGESMSRDWPQTRTQLAMSDHIYSGMFMHPKDALGSKDGEVILNKITALENIARDFTLQFLAGTKTEAAWDTYTKALDDAGYADVFEYYRNSAYAYVDEYNESVSSQSDIRR